MKGTEDDENLDKNVFLKIVITPLKKMQLYKLNHLAQFSS